MIIDTDLHPAPIHEQVAEYLEEPWRSRYLRGDHGAGHPNYFNPGGVMRSDAVTEDGRRIERSPETMASHFLDVYEIDYAVMNPMEAMEHCVSPDAHYSAAALTAVNRHFVEDWLPADERYLASIMVAFSNIELAVGEIHRWGAHPRVVQVLGVSGSPFRWATAIFIPFMKPLWHTICLSRFIRGWKAWASPDRAARPASPPVIWNGIPCWRHPL